MVYFNVTFSSDNTVYTYPSCCVFMRQPVLRRTSGDTTTKYLRRFFDDLEPLIRCWYEKRDFKVTLRPASSRIPWQEKLASDIQQDNELKKHLRPPEGLNGRSKYFNDVMICINERSTEAENTPMHGRKKLVNSRITEYFSLRHPGIKVRRTAGKITFRVRKISLIIKNKNLGTFSFTAAEQPPRPFRRV